MKRLRAYSIVLHVAAKAHRCKGPSLRPLDSLRGDNEYVLPPKPARSTRWGDSAGCGVRRDCGHRLGGLRSIRTTARAAKALCVFEYIYFSRPDSVVEGTSVHEARRRAGALLALRHPVEADVVIGVPDSGIDAAIGYSQQSGIPYEIGFIKNKYIGRTFIQPDQKEREDRVRIKLNVVGYVVKDKRVVMIDDSIVRGTTSARIVTLLREAGAREIHMRVSAPPFLYPCYFGTDIDSQENLIANRHTVDEIARIIGVDSLGYLSVSDLGSLVSDSCAGLCDACFTGNYAVDVSGVSEKSRFDRKICEHKED